MVSGQASGQPRITKQNYESSLVGTWALAQLVAEAPLEEMLGGGLGNADGGDGEGLHADLAAR